MGKGVPIYGMSVYKDEATCTCPMLYHTSVLRSSEARPRAFRGGPIHGMGVYKDAAYQSYVPHVVPHVGTAFVRGQTEGLQEAVDGHVVLLSIETAQAQVGE